MLGNSENRYGLVSRGIHGIMFLLIIGLVIAGVYMTGLDKTDEMRRQIYGMHMATGFLVFLLAVVRVVWLKISPAPKLPIGLNNWEKILTSIVKSLMYLLMLAIPMVGYLMVNAKGYPVSFYGLFNLPVLVGENEGLNEFLNAIHGPMAMLLILLVVLHVAGSLKHRFLDTGPDLDVMKRMFGRD
jgi:cytochrome b561